MKRSTTTGLGAVEFKVAAQTGFDASLLVCSQFGSVSTKDLDAVVFGGIVTGRHHQATGCSDLTDQQRHRRSGAQPQGPDLPSSSCQTCREGRRNHGAAAAGIHADQDRSVTRQHPPAPVADLQTERRGEQVTNTPPDPIGAETRNSAAQGRTDGMNSALNHGSHSWTAGYGRCSGHVLQRRTGADPPFALIANALGTRSTASPPPQPRRITAPQPIPAAAAAARSNATATPPRPQPQLQHISTVASGPDERRIA